MARLRDIKELIRELTASGVASKAGFVKYKDVLNILEPRNEDAHKGNFGHCLVIAGSQGKSGAAILCSVAALRSGCGLVTSMVNEEAVSPLLCRIPESMVMLRGDLGWFWNVDITKFNAVAFGPGVGVNEESSGFLFRLLSESNNPVVIDADGLTILSHHPGWLTYLTSRCVLTPHEAEFDRITKQHSSREERIKTQLEFSNTHQVTVVLKGRHTAITTPSAELFINTTGNNGMATAGSGDVLTGMIASLIAQGYSPWDAARIAVYFHGAAGDKAAEKRSAWSMIAGDIIEHLRIQ